MKTTNQVMSFENWGKLENPIRQSDLTSLFSNQFGCAKRFYLGRIYPRGQKVVSYKGFMGEVVHDLLRTHLANGYNQDVWQVVSERTKTLKVDWGTANVRKEIAEYQKMVDLLIKSKAYREARKRLVFAERAFLVQIAGFAVAGTIDCVIRGRRKGELIVLDWKTGATPTQYEMDRGYQTAIYMQAVKSGVFYDRPESMENGTNYYESFRRSMDNGTVARVNSNDRYPRFFFVHLRDLLPATRASRRIAAHRETQEAADGDGKYRVRKGGRKGPAWYEARPGTFLERLCYSIKCAVLFARSGLFPESFGAACQKCGYREKCERLGTNIKMKHDVIAMMKDLGIEPD